MNIKGLNKKILRQVGVLVINGNLNDDIDF